ncbi:hypothetical protein MNEG_3504 [Monoraphidium neglectum]|uniref:Uncharacterized protein n=1 Tax=Monoraphidium neglectum TaxID=145388 RepID=A0A0D2MVB4_9CHLO|nr:hypothetical protein MNEG_3504 [Monoraphidium neglectum]KIZ04457.1 hypothetical protein MNEG_3504 [Monoraphidium neglectum]|eukprot:XP_013903476.1 hypothetical protein MNEG_3504 [Monoraphidium neglectum]
MTLEALKAQIEQAVSNLATKMEQGNRETNRAFKAQAGTLEKMAGQHYEATVAAQQAAADSMQVAGDAHAQALGEVASAGKRLAGGLQASSKSTLAAAQAVASQVARDAGQLAAQHGIRAGGAGGGGGGPAAGAPGGGRGRGGG